MTLTRRILWTLTVSYWLVIFTATHLPPAYLVGAPALSDKLVHFLAYLALSFLVGTTFYLAFPTRRRIMPWAVIVLAAAYGAFDEVTQGLVRRTPDLHDWYADCAGAVAAALVLYVLVRLFPTRAEMPVAQASG
jgi:VanZ family protein